MDQPTHTNSLPHSSRLRGKKALLLVNPLSRQGKEVLETALASLREHGYEVVVPEFKSPAEFSELVRKHATSVDVAIVGGGDGSIRCAVAGLLETGLPLGILPMGTANNLARNLGIVADLPSALAVLNAGDTRMIDVAQINDHFFLNVAGMGLSSTVNKEVPSQAKKRWGVLAYAATAFQHWKKHRPFHVDIKCDGEMIRVRTMQITICNGRYFGSGLDIDQNASITDGMLDVISLETSEWWRGFGFMKSLWSGDGEKRKGLRRLSGRDIEIRTHHRVPIDVDGDVLSKTPAKLSVRPGALCVVAPPVVDAKL